MISQETNVFGHLVYTKTGLCSQVSLGRVVGYNTLSAIFSVFKLTNNELNWAMVKVVLLLSNNFG